MYEKEHTAAVTLQRSLLPGELPSVRGLALDARYLPRSTDVGGDWYDVFRLPDRRLAVTVGDVMGKGLLAAAGMGRVRNALRALALTDPRPAAVLAGLDRLFTATELEDYVTTVTYLVIDPETGEGQAGNAGHPPTLLLTPGALPVLDSAEAGTPLGWASPRGSTPSGCRRALPRSSTPTAWSRTGCAASTPASTSSSGSPRTPRRTCSARPGGCCSTCSTTCSRGTSKTTT